VRKVGIAFLTAALLFTAACGGADDSKNGEGAEVGSANLTKEGWLEFAVPAGWESSDSAADDTWSVEGWTTAWMADLEDEEAGLLLVNGEYGPDGAAVAAGRLVSDTYFGGFPGFVSDGARWIEPEDEDGPRIRRVDFTYKSADDQTGSGVIWAVEDAKYRTTVAAVKGADLSESVITEIEESLDFDNA